MPASDPPARPGPIVVAMTAAVLVLIPAPAPASSENDRAAADAEAWLQARAAEAREGEFHSAGRFVVNSMQPDTGTLMMAPYVVRADRAAGRAAIKVPTVGHVFLDDRTLNVILEGIEDIYLQVEFAERPDYETLLELLAPIVPPGLLLSPDCALAVDGNLEGMLPGLTGSPITDRHREPFGGEIEPADADHHAFTYGDGRVALAFEDGQRSVTAFVTIVRDWRLDQIADGLRRRSAREDIDEVRARVTTALEHIDQKVDELAGETSAIARRDLLFLNLQREQLREVEALLTGRGSLGRGVKRCRIRMALAPGAYE